MKTVDIPTVRAAERMASIEDGKLRILQEQESNERAKLFYEEYDRLFGRRRTLPQYTMRQPRNDNINQRSDASDSSEEGDDE